MNKIKVVLMVSIICCLILMGHQINSEKKKSQGRITTNYVPTEKVAREVAVIILTPIFGEEIINKQKPFKATLVGDSVWVVTGARVDSEGGTAYIEIRKRDCKILNVTHEK